ncbi:hypothetical protein [Mesorhizobium sp. M7A.F.Ca.MR.148.00.0.0]|nr:hypothetical protein [Mesorhizobium sp. M7A.F.Ca.MR.148.00.0.0]
MILTGVGDAAAADGSEGFKQGQAVAGVTAGTGKIGGKSVHYRSRV